MKLGSVGEIAREYFMIVVGISTALGLEHMVSNYEHAKAAAESRSRIVAELRSDLTELRSSNDENVRRLKSLASLSDEMIEGLNNGQSTEKIVQIIYGKSHGIMFGISLPAFRHEAWDVAVANQSAGFMDPVALLRFSRAYAAERNALSATEMGTGFGPRLTDTMLDIKLHRVDPVESLRAFQQMIGALRTAIGNMTEAQKEMESSLSSELESEPAPVK